MESSTGIGFDNIQSDAHISRIHQLSEYICQQGNVGDQPIPFRPTEGRTCRTGSRQQQGDPSYSSQSTQGPEGPKPQSLKPLVHAFVRRPSPQDRTNIRRPDPSQFL
jgi:hypothetical protein